MKYWLIRIACVLALTGCASMPAAPHAAGRAKPSPEPTPKAHAQPHSLLQMDPAFLYLASQAALLNDQPELAARFLAALVVKEPTAVEPRMDLAGIYMQLNQPPLAMQQIDAARKIPGLSRDQRKELDMLHVRALFGSGKVKAAIAALTRLVAAHPDLTSARQILVQWLAGSGRIDEALAAGLKRACPLLREDVVAHQREHAIEVQLPFLQRVAGEFTFVPVALGTIVLAALEELGEAIARVIEQSQEPVLVAASSDMNHYESDSLTRPKDRRAIEKILELDPCGLYETVRQHDISMCGFAAAVTMLFAVKRLGASSAELVSYATSGDVTGDREAVVGYAGVVVR